MLHRLFQIILICLITACGKPTTAKKPDSGIPTIPAATQEEKPSNAPRASMDEAAQIATLIDPNKLATLKSRGANPRILKITAILITAKAAGKNPDEITQQAVKKIGWGGTPAGELTTIAILRNLEIIEELGSTTPGDIAEMRKGQSPIVRRGSSTGDIVSIDHNIPVAAAPELSNVIANLELLPLKLNQRKGDSIGSRQRHLAKQLHAAGLLKNPNLPE